MTLLSGDTKLKILWYLMFSALGVFHAEVLSWSSPTVLYNPANFLLVTPVYAVHYILFGDLLLRSSRTDYTTIYVFGALTGMYETFITKVYWSPPWNPDAAGPLGVAWLELSWIGFTWHAFMSFLIPFRLMLLLFTPEGKGLKSRELRAILIATPLLGSTLGYGFGIPIEVMLPSILLSFLVIAVLALLLMAGSRRWRFIRTEQLVLGRSGRWLAVGFFLLVYALYGLLLRPEFFPLDTPLLPILSIYAGLIGLAAVLLRKSSTKSAMVSLELETPRSAMRYLLSYAASSIAIFLAVGALSFLIPGVFPVVVAVLIYAGAALPLVLLPALAVRALRRGRPRSVAPA